MTYLAISYFTDVYNRIIVQCTLYTVQYVANWKDIFYILVANFITIFVGTTKNYQD